MPTRCTTILVFDPPTEADVRVRNLSGPAKKGR